MYSANQDVADTSCYHARYNLSDHFSFQLTKMQFQLLAQDADEITSITMGMQLNCRMR